MDLDRITIIILALALFFMGCLAQYLIYRLTALTKWQQSITDALLKVSQDAIEVARGGKE